MEKTAVFDLKKLYDHIYNIFLKTGLSEQYAADTADLLIRAEQRGVRSHGVIQVKNYVDGYLGGSFNIKPDIKILRESDSALIIDADKGPGATTGKCAISAAIEKAKKTGAAVSSVKNATHFGMAAYYAMEALKHDQIGFAFTNSVPFVAPFGGYKKETGTNPICVAVPAGKNLPIVFDAATSEAAFNKIYFAKTEGRRIPLNWALDENGDPTDDPDAVISGGALVPFGGYKGYGLNIVTAVLTGILSGAGIVPNDENGLREDPFGIGYFFAAIDIAAFQDADIFKHSVDLFIDRIRSSQRRDPDTPIYMPGEPEFINEQKALKNGIELSESTVNDLISVTERVGLDTHFLQV